MGNGVPAEAKVSEDGQTPYEDRMTLGDWAGKMLKNEKLFEYKKANNSKSLDGLPGLKTMRRAQGHTDWMDLVETKAKIVVAQKDTLLVGILIGVLLMITSRMAGVRF